jgi:hypothetical protein
MLTWWDCLGKNKQLIFFVLRSSDRLIGIVPLMKVRKSFMRLPYDEVYLLSATKNPFSPRAFAGTLDFLIPDEFAVEYEYFIRYLLTTYNEWNYLKLHPLPQNSPALKMLQKIAPELHGEVSIIKVLDNACVSVSGTWEEYWSGRSFKLQKNINRLYRRLMEHHQAEFIEYRKAEEMDQAIEDILAIEQKSWKLQNGVRINDPGRNNFYFSLVRNLSKKNMTRIWILRIDGVPAAYDVHVQYGKSIKTLAGSFKEDFAAFSPEVC